MSLEEAEAGTRSQAAEGQAFSVSAKVIAGVLIGYLLYAVFQVAGKYSWAELPVTGCAFVLIVLACLFYTYYWILVSRTRIDREFIRQSWYRDKTVRIADITKVKFVCVPYFEWLVAPRIVIHVSGRGSYTFYAANREVLTAFARLSMGLGV
jgi:ABC-type transport system involved in Fe-S cluster assembly fused permease/ATPase subunit